MSLGNKLGGSFDSLARRVLHSYAAVYPDFAPVEGVCPRSQEQLYVFLREALYAVCENPDIIGAGDEPDDCYEDWQMNNTKPALIASMLKIEKKFMAHFELLLRVGRFGQPENGCFRIAKTDWAVNKAVAAKLAAVGLVCDIAKDCAIVTAPEHSEIYEAWKAFAMEDEGSSPPFARVIRFIHGRYFGKLYHAADFFGPLCGDRQALADLEAYLAEKGFLCTNEHEGTTCRHAYAQWQRACPNKDFIRFSAAYEFRRRNPMRFELRIPGFRMLLHTYTQMDEALQRFAFQRTKTCDGCGYCNQTDKSGQRPRLAMMLSAEGETKAKCPLYPNLTWRHMDNGVRQDIQRLLDYWEASLER